VTGTVTYRVRRALPPDSVVIVSVLDVSVADAPAEIIGRQELRTDGRQVPVAFTVEYDPSTVDPKHRYAVRATISTGGALQFTSTTSVPVITNGAPTDGIELVLDPAR